MLLIKEVCSVVLFLVVHLYFNPIEPSLETGSSDFGMNCTFLNLLLLNNLLRVKLYLENIFFLTFHQMALHGVANPKAIGRLN